MAENTSIDATDLLYIPLVCLEELLSDLDSNAPGTDFVLTVVRQIAFLLICGSVTITGSSKAESSKRGFDMLGVLAKIR
jgi:hypothetical protein